jgi:predicted DNA-binding transcriptional regulator AlpA
MSTTEILRRERQRKASKRKEREQRRSRRLVRPKEAQKRLGVGHSKFYKDFINSGRLRLVELGPRSKAAVEDELDDLIEELIAERDEKPQHKVTT